MTDKIEIANETYYDSDDIQEIVAQVWAHTLAKPSRFYGYVEGSTTVHLRVQYLAAATPYAEDTRRGGYRHRPHHFSLEAQGWGDLLTEGEERLASAHRTRSPGKRDSQHVYFALSIARQEKTRGTSDLERLASTMEDGISSKAVRHIIYALFVAFHFHGAVPFHWEDEVSPRQFQVHIRGKDAASALRAQELRAQARVSEALKVVKEVEYDLSRAERHLDRLLEERAEAQAKVTELEAKLASIRQRLADQGEEKK